MNVRTKIVAVLAAAAAPLAAFAANPTSAGNAEAAARSGQTLATDPATTPQSTTDFTRRFREAVAGGAGYNEASQIAGDATPQAPQPFEVSPSSRAVYRGMDDRAWADYGLTSYDAAPLRE